MPFPFRATPPLLDTEAGQAGPDEDTRSLVKHRVRLSIALYLGAAALAAGYALATALGWAATETLAGALVVSITAAGIVGALVAGGLTAGPTDSPPAEPPPEPESAAAGAPRPGAPVAAPDPDCCGLIDDLGEVIFATDPQGRLCFLNQAWRTITMEDATSVLDSRLDERIHPAEQALHHGHFQAVVEALAPARRYEARLIGSNGEPRWMEIRIRPRLDADGRLLGVAGIMSDIHARKQAEDALKARDRSLSALLEHLPGMAFRCRNDRHWTMEFVSDGCFELTGLEAIDLISQRSYEELIHPDDRERVWDRTQERIAVQAPFHLRYRICLPDGSPKWVEERSRGIFASDGTLLAIEGFIADGSPEPRVETRTHAPA